jgi:predicted XRE-type DNA-binding protein
MGSPRNRRRQATSSSVRRKRSAPRATRERLRGAVEHVTPANGNVFRDLGFPPAEAENLKVRSDLMSALQDMIAERGLTQVQAAKLFGVAQPRVSDLCRDKIDRFTIDTLINMLAHAGMRVQLKVGRPAA